MHNGDNSPPTGEKRAGKAHNPATESTVAQGALLSYTPVSLLVGKRRGRLSTPVSLLVLNPKDIQELASLLGHSLIPGTYEQSEINVAESGRTGESKDIQEGRDFSSHPRINLSPKGNRPQLCNNPATESPSAQGMSETQTLLFRD